MYITLKEARKHLNLDDYFKEDDGYILNLIETAEEATSARLNRDLRELVDPKTGELSRVVRQMVLLLVGTWYSQREAAGTQSVRAYPLAFDFLGDMYRKHVIG